MIEYRVIRRHADIDNPDKGTVLAWGNETSTEAICQKPPMHIVYQDSCAGDPNYVYILQAYILTAGGHCHGWWDIRTLKGILPWRDMTNQFIGPDQYFTWSNVPVVYNPESLSCEDIELVSA